MDSRNDGVVAWEVYIDHLSAHVEHVEVRTTHIGLGISPEVYRIVAERLSKSSAEARPTDAPDARNASNTRTSLPAGNAAEGVV